MMQRAAIRPTIRRGTTSPNNPVCSGSLVRGLESEEYFNEIIDRLKTYVVKKELEIMNQKIRSNKWKDIIGQ
jgi:hypothetical protein